MKFSIHFKKIKNMQSNGQIFKICSNGIFFTRSVGSQIILSQILAIQNSNHTQEYKYLRGKPFLFEGTTRQTPNNFIIIKSIAIILVYAPWLKKKKISLIFLCSHTHKLYFSKVIILFLFFFHYVAPTFFSSPYMPHKS